MNTANMKAISIILSVMFVVSSIFGVPVYAISESCVEDHFSRLTTTGDGEERVIRTPPSENSCAYVAMSMLLTFYDSYWNNRFVDDHYEWQNGEYDSLTDDLSETFAPIAEAADWDEYIDSSLPIQYPSYYYYKDYAALNVDNFFEPYLVSLGTELNYHPASDPFLGLTDEETVIVLENYLFETNRFQSNEITVNYRFENDGYNIEQIMTEQINKGFPVIYIGKMRDGDNYYGHELIAYGIDENGDILLHTGWSENEFDTLSNTDFNLMRAIIWLEIDEENLPHTCSDNYLDVATNNLVCSCEIYSSHSAHDPDYYHDIMPNNSVTHCYKCDCGYIFNVQSHNLTYSYYNPTQHYEDCADCTYMGAKTHSYTTVMSSTSASGHQAACVCGQTTTEEHYVWDYVSQGRDSHAIYCECGYLIGTEYHDMEPGFKLGTSCCAICGYIRDNSGFGEAIMGTEDDAEASTK